jgi:hypothetical protein
MTKTETRPKAVQHSHGRTKGYGMGSLPTGIASHITSTERVRRLYGDLETDEERKGFFDEFLKQQRNGFGEAWMAIYQTVDLIRENDWYWKEAGFDSFEGFWQTQGEALFGRWAELEATYQYAHMAAPGLFEVDYDEAKAISQRLASYRSLTPAMTPQQQRSHAGSQKRTRDHEFVSPAVDPRLYVAELASDDFNAGYNAAPRNGNGEDRRTRFRRILRDSPEVAERFLAGEFIRRYKNGRPPEEDLVAAEVAAGIRKEGEKVQRRNGLAYAMKLIGTFNTKQLTELQTFVNQLLESRK